MRLVICDDHVMFTEALSEMLVHLGHNVVDVIHDAPQAVTSVLAHRPDICLLDVRLPSGSGLLILPALRMASPATRVVVLTGMVDSTTSAEARRLGAAAFVGKDQSLDSLQTVFDTVMSRPPPPPRLTVGSPLPRTGIPDRGNHRLRLLTARERQVLGALLGGGSTRDIAEQLGVERSTARTHIQNVLVKLGVHSRLEAAALVTRDDLDVDRDSSRLMQQR